MTCLGDKLGRNSGPAGRTEGFRENRATATEYRQQQQRMRRVIKRKESAIYITKQLNA